MSTYYTCSFITTSSAALTTIRNEMKTPTNAKLGIPNRVVAENPYLSGSFNKIGSFYLTKEEYKNLHKNPGIKTVELIPSSEDERRYFEISATGSITEGPFRASTSNPNSQTWTLHYLNQPNSSSLYEGELGMDTFDRYFSGIGETGSRNFTLDGEGIDIVQTEPSSLLHYEYFGKDGKYRVQFINWYEEIGEPENKDLQPRELYKNNASTGVEGTEHGNMTLSLAAGLTAGHAKGAKIYYLPSPKSGGGGYDGFSEAEQLRILKKFHENKPINPLTGYKRPTLVTNSTLKLMKSERQYLFEPSEEESTARRANRSGSFTLNSLQENEGLRIQYGDFHWVLVSSSIGVPGGEQPPYPLAGPYGEVVTKPMGGLSGKYRILAFTGSMNNIVSAITGSHLSTGVGKLRHVIYSCSYDDQSKEFSVTSSFRNLVYGTNNSFPIKFYTGSFDPNVGFRPTKVPGTDQWSTGSLVGQLYSDSDFNNHINSMVIGGVEKVTDPNNSNYFNTKTLAMARGIYNALGYGSGSTSNWYSIFDVYNYPNSHAEYVHLAHSAITDEMYQECAEAGVVWFKCSANEELFITQTSASGNTFFDPDRYDEFLANSYYTLDVDMGTSFLAGEKVYTNLASPSNGSAIIVANGPRGIGGWTFVDEDLQTNMPRMRQFGAKGPGVDIMAPGRGSKYAAGDNAGGYYPNPYYEPFISSSFFDTASVIEHLKQNYLAAWNASDQFFSTNMHGQSTGCSASTPIVCGLTACWLQANPWAANVKDVRNWLKTRPSLMPSSSISLSDNPLLYGTFDADATGSLFLASTHDQMGDNPCTNIAWNPQSSSKPVEFKGPLIFKNMQFTPISNKSSYI